MDCELFGVLERSVYVVVAIVVLMRVVTALGGVREALEGLRRTTASVHALTLREAEYRNEASTSRQREGNDGRP